VVTLLQPQSGTSRLLIRVKRASPWSKKCP
jgi:hypothetical protein